MTMGQGPSRPRQVCSQREGDAKSKLTGSGNIGQRVQMAGCPGAWEAPLRSHLHVGTLPALPPTGGKLGKELE